MELLSTGEPFDPIMQFGSRLAAARTLAAGAGEAHAYVVRIEAGGLVDRHVAGFGQLWIVIDGSGWVEGGDGARVGVRAGDVAFFARGETHAKGSDDGLTAVMVQVRDLTVAD